MPFVHGQGRGDPQVEYDLRLLKKYFLLKPSLSQPPPLIILLNSDGGLMFPLIVILITGPFLSSL